MVHGFWLANCYKNPPCAIMPDQVKVLKAQRPHHRDLAVGSRALAIGRKIGIRGRKACRYRRILSDVDALGPY